MNQSLKAGSQARSGSSEFPPDFHRVRVTAGLVNLDERRLTNWLAQFREDTGLLLDFGRVAGVYAIYCLPDEKEEVRQMVLSVGLSSLRGAIREYLEEAGHLTDSDIERCLESPFNR